jgi:hypothetical protein
MTSKILVAVNATRDASASMLDAFQIIQKDRLSVKVLFISYLSDLFKKSLGPNTLNHWVKEEKESIEKVNNYFGRMNVPYEHKVIIVPPWEIVFHEISDEAGDQALIILHSELLRKWRKDKTNCALCSDILSKERCPILVINSTVDTPMDGESN